MNQEFPIVIPPDENTEAGILLRETTRKNVGFFQRKVVAELIAQLNGVLQDAAMEIGMAPMIYESPAKHRMMNYGRVAGMPPAELSAYLLDVKGRYEAWRRRMLSTKPLRMTMSNGKPMFTNAAIGLSICERVCQQEESIYVIRVQEKISEKTAYRFLRYGLNEYSVSAGWGNQIE